MAILTAATPHSQAEKSSALFRELRDFWRQFFVAAFTPYRPERHYMRGPGPAWRAKHGDAAPPHQS